MKDIHFQQNGCRAITMRWFKEQSSAFQGEKYTVKRQKMKKENSKECSVFFLWRKGSFSSRNRPSRNSVCFEMQPRQRRFSEFSGTFCTLWPSKIMFLKGNFCIYKCFINVLYIFFFGAKEKVQNAPRFEMNFLLNFAMCSADFTCVNGCTIDSVTRIALRD